MMNSNDNEEKKLNQEVLDRLKFNILRLEKNNSRTTRKGETDMVEKIRKLIQSEVDNNDN